MRERHKMSEDFSEKEKSKTSEVREFLQKSKKNTGVVFF
jgi:hypothetical protein